MHGIDFLKEIYKMRNQFLEKGKYNKCKGFGDDGSQEGAQHFIEHYAFEYLFNKNENVFTYHFDKPLISCCSLKQYCQGERCSEDNDF